MTSRLAANRELRWITRSRPNSTRNDRDKHGSDDSLTDQRQRKKERVQGEGGAGGRNREGRELGKRREGGDRKGEGLGGQG